MKLPKMKVTLLFLVACCVFSIAQGKSRGCIYIDGICEEECPEGTHIFVSNCHPPTWSKLTCAEPKARDLGNVCDMSRCDCDLPKVYDEENKKCVNLEDCPNYFL